MLAELLRRSAWLAAGSALGRALPLLVLLAASRRLDAAGFATISAAVAWTAVATSLSSTGLATVLAQHLGPVDDAATRRAMLRHYLLRSLLAAAALALLVMLAGRAGATALFGAALDARVVWPAALAGALWSQVAVAVAALNGSHRPRAAAATMAFSGLLQGLPMAAALAAGATPLNMAWAMAAGSAAGAALAAWQLRLAFGAGVLAQPLAQHRTRPLGGRPVLWQSVAVAAVMPVGFLASAIVARGPDGAHQLALYFLLEQVYLMLSFGPALLGQALMPMISRQAGEAVHALRRIVLASVAVAAAGLLAAAVLSLQVETFAAWLQHPVLRPQDAWACRWMLGCAALVACSSLLGGAMQGRGDMARASQLNIGWCVAFVGTTVLLAAHGTAGLQFARFAATLGLITVTATVLLRQARASSGRPFSGASTGQ